MDKDKVEKKLAEVSELAESLQSSLDLSIKKSEKAILHKDEQISKLINDNQLILGKLNALKDRSTAVAGGNLLKPVDLAVVTPQLSAV
jgi:hypothetical protein